MAIHAGGLPVAAALLGVEQQVLSQVGQQRQQQPLSQGRGVPESNGGAPAVGPAAAPQQRLPNAGVKGRADDACLQAALPLAPKARVRIPLMLHAAQVLPPSLAANCGRKTKALSDKRSGFPIKCKLVR